MTQTLYRFWDAEGTLLYVGITVRPWQRWREHRGEKPWWEEVASVTLEGFTTREEVAAAELAAIRSECPLYNIAGRRPATPPAAVDVEPEDWDGVHRPQIAFIDNYYWCDCAEPDWDAPECGLSEQEHWQASQVSPKGATMQCDECDRLHSEWLMRQPFYTPDTYADHVIESVLGEQFAGRVTRRMTPV